MLAVTKAPERQLFISTHSLHILLGLLDSAELHEIAPGMTVTLGPFQAEFVHVTHSTIECVALAIRTPLGIVLHTGDFKIDPTPVDSIPFDLHRFARYGQEGVLALFADRKSVVVGKSVDNGGRPIN